MIDVDLATDQSHITTVQKGLDTLFPSRTIERVLLVTPPDADATIFRLETAHRKRYANYPPYGLALLATRMRQLGIHVSIVNLQHHILKKCFEVPASGQFHFDDIWKQELTRQIEITRPDLIGVTCMFSMTHVSFRNVCQFLQTWKLPIMVGGVHVTNDIERVLQDVPGIDIIFTNEADLSLPLFVNVVNRHAKISDLAQLLLKNGDSWIRIARTARPEGSDLDHLPAFDLLAYHEYSEYGVIGSFYHLTPEGTRYATSQAVRGCRGSCTFCAARGFNGNGVRRRSPESVVHELRLLKEKFGIGHFMWLDDDLFNNEKATLALFESIIRADLDMTWDATNGVIAAACSNPVLEAAQASGCIGLHIGMESGNDEILRRIRKPGTVRHFLQAAQNFRNFENIYASVFVMIGFPGETKAMIADTMRVAREMDLDWYSIGLLQPLPNTPIYEEMKALGQVDSSADHKPRFMIGSYGAMADREKASELIDRSFEHAFKHIPDDAVPSGETLTDIWFYMDYHLNYHRLFTETRERKLKQQVRKLEKISNIVSPEHGFALYFLGLLQHRLYGSISPEIVARLEKQISVSPYWSGRLTQFGLCLRHLEEQTFPLPDQIPRPLQESRTAHE